VASARATAGLATILVLLQAGAALAQTAPPPPPPSAPKTPTVTGVVVSAQRPAVRTSIDRTIYNVGDDPQSETGTAADVLRGLPSVDVDVDGNPSLRGDGGVQILLNGKLTPMLSGADRGAILQMMGAAAIDSVEVITNPSARFNPDGAAGVINIITKKNYRPGPTGVLRANMGEEGRYNLGFNGSDSLGPLNIHGGLSLRQDTRRRQSDTARSNPDAATGQIVTSDQTVASQAARNFRSAYLGIDYDITKIDALTLDLSYDDRGGPPRSVEHDVSSLPASDFLRLGGGDSHGADADASARYTHTFAGDDHLFTLDMKWSQSQDRSRNSYRDVFTLPAGPDTADDQVARSRETQEQLQAEYTAPLAGGAKLDAGYSLRRSDDLYFNGADALNPLSGAATPNLAQTNQFAFAQTIHALFATYQKPFGKLQMMAGLRLEQVFIDTDQQTTGLVDHSGYLRLYPSLHLDYPLTKTQTLKASYSLRINRPGPDDLNPFVVVQDPQNESSGNPRLTPQQTHALEATWQHAAHDATQSVTAYFRQTEDALTDVSRYVAPTLLLTTKANLGRIRSVGFDVSANGKPSKIFSYTINAYLFDNQVAASNLGFSGTKQGVGYSGKISVNWRPTPKDQLQLSANYNGERLTPQGERLPNGGMDIGYRRNLTGNLSAVFTVSDLFDSRGEKTVIDSGAVHDIALRRSQGRIAYAGLTWRLGGARKRPQDDRISY
jgi:outer membrane receptor protein involved in Fe transport